MLLGLLKTSRRGLRLHFNFQPIHTIPMCRSLSSHTQIVVQRRMQLLKEKGWPGTTQLQWKEVFGNYPEEHWPEIYLSQWSTVILISLVNWHVVQAQTRSEFFTALTFWKTFHKPPFLVMFTLTVAVYDIVLCCVLSTLCLHLTQSCTFA